MPSSWRKGITTFPLVNRTKNRSLVLLSGEGITVPASEAKALFLAADPRSTFETPEPRVLIADSEADPLAVGERIAFARRVGFLLRSVSDASGLLTGHRVRFRSFDLSRGRPEPDPGEYLEGIGAVVDLTDPEYELTLVRGRRDYLAVTAPSRMLQGWSRRRPRSRPFFHPSAIFPKLSRALVNMSRCKQGDVFLEPFTGTGSIAIEASLVGADVVAIDLSDKMVRGASSNMRRYAQDWLGIVRADSARLPVRGVRAAATDIPYGRASSTRGRPPELMVELLLPELARAMDQGSFLVLMHPKSVAVEPTSEFATEEEHHLQVHKFLTRTITVLKRR
jgi:tRNA (guanine10-N2)-dimethyltransferase